MTYLSWRPEWTERPSGPSSQTPSAGPSLAPGSPAPELWTNSGTEQGSKGSVSHHQLQIQASGTNTVNHPSGAASTQRHLQDWTNFHYQGPEGDSAQKWKWRGSSLGKAHCVASSDPYSPSAHVTTVIPCLCPLERHPHSTLHHNWPQQLPPTY